jgi:transcriptional regulator with XRE-family HTH domain
MSASIFTEAEISEAQRAAREIGTALRSARHLRRERDVDCAKRIGVQLTTLRRFERGDEHNVKLGTVVRMVTPFGLEIGILPRIPAARSERVANLVDRILALPGGEDLMRYHLQQRGLELARRAEP